MSIPVALHDELAQWDLNESTVNDFFASYLTRSTLLFAILNINNRQPDPRWRTELHPKGDWRPSPEGRPRHEVPSKKTGKPILRALSLLVCGL